MTILPTSGKWLFLVICITGCGDKYRVIHKPLTILSQCNFEKFTKLEKDSMIEEVGRKIYRNQNNCKIRQKRIDTMILEHNLAHKNE